LSLYGQRGYLDAHVEAESVIAGENAFVTLKITENRQSVVGKIIVRGNILTKDKVIWREFTLEEGDIYNHEEILRIKQRLYKLGLFNEVSAEMIDTEEVIEGKRVRDILVTVKEGNAGSIEVGGGYGDYEKLRGSFDISYNNLGGYNRKIGFRTELSEVEEKYILNFREPWFANKPDMPLNVFLMFEDTRAVSPDDWDDTLYKIERFSLLTDIGKKLSEHWKANLNYEYAYVKTTDVDPGVVLSKEDVGTVGIGSISPSIFFDNRDNPFNPTSGSLYGLVMKFASKAFLSEVEFIKGTFESSWYFGLRKWLVLALALKGGASHSFDDDEELPLVERFFLGGRTTVRGYENDNLGPKGADDTPTGGNFFALTNAELRFNVGKGFGIVTFIDSGNVWQTDADIDGDLKSTVGAGLRYYTPVGPVRIDYGYKLDRERGESEGEVHFSFGHAF
jgi:outer membrane protein insertion porin family